MGNTETYVFDNGGKTADRYMVVINLADEQGRASFNYWYMSSDALMPNGVCMYGGVLSEAEVSDLFANDLPIRVWPKQVKTQIQRLSAWWSTEQ